MVCFSDDDTDVMIYHIYMIHMQGTFGYPALWTTPISSASPRSFNKDQCCHHFHSKKIKLLSSIHNLFCSTSKNKFLPPAAHAEHRGLRHHRHRNPCRCRGSPWFLILLVKKINYHHKSMLVSRITGTGTAAIDDEAQKSRMRKTRIFTSVKTFCSRTRLFDTW